MILFSVGKDRPGIVEDVSTLLFEHGANIEDSRMAALGGCFSIMILFSCSEQQLDTLKEKLTSLHRLGLESFLYEAEDPDAGSLQPTLPIKLEVRAIDHPGIVKKVVHILHQHDVNIYSLKTEVIRAPLSGAPLFELLLEANVPVEAPLGLIKEKLTRLAGEMNLDLNFVK